MNENLIAATAREVTFSVIDHATRRCIRTERRPAGTEVYARVRKDGKLSIRIPGTLLTQHVYASAIDIP